MAITSPVYATRESVKDATDIKETARNNRRIDDILMSAARAVEGTLHREFYPVLTTRKFDWPPDGYYGPSWELDLDSNEMISVNTVTAGGIVIPTTDYTLRRADDKNEPPYNRLEIVLSTSSAFSSGSTFQQAIEIYGLFNYSDNSTVAGQTSQSINDSVTSLTVTDSASIGVGSIIKIDNERALVADKSLVDTGQNLGADIASNKNAVIVNVQSGAAFSVDEVILINAERMRIVDIAGNNLIVIRQWDGTTLAAHTAPADIYAPRNLTLVRGALGTTAAAHNTGVNITKWLPPPLVSVYNLAIALNDNRLGIAGYSPDIFANKGLQEKAEQAYTAHGRKLRLGAV